jgi:CIC family chloride channel protein
LAQTDTGITLGDVASQNFTIVRETTLVFDVIRRIWQKNAVMAVVVHGQDTPRGTDVVGVISKEHVADSVAESVKFYPD